MRAMASGAYYSEHLPNDYAYRTDTRAGAGLTCHGFAALLHAHPEQAARERNDTVAVATRRAPADVVRFVRVGSGVVDACCAHTSINPHEGGEEFGVAPLAALTVLLEGVRRSPHFFARPALEGAKAFAPSEVLPWNPVPLDVVDWRCREIF